MNYAALWCKTNYSFLAAASHPDEMVSTAHLLGLSAIAITDIDGVYGVVRAHVRARDIGVHLIIGSQITLDDGSYIVLLAMNRLGFANLCQLISSGRLRCVKGESRVRYDEVCAHADGLIALWGGEGSSLASRQGETADAMAPLLREAFGDRLYALLTRHKEAVDVTREARTRSRANRYGISTVAGYEALYHTVARRPLHDVLSCIRHGLTLTTAGTAIRANTEHALVSDAAMRLLYADDPSSLTRTSDIAARCTFDLRELRYRYPSERLPDGSTSAQYLRTLCEQGVLWRYGGPNAAAQAQLYKELSVIEELDYCGYFLSMRDIVTYCQEHAILCQGRGSAANSIVCYLLGITAVDPIKYDLLFERFISRERAEAPDIDLDIAHGRREEVIQHVYAKYGRSHAAMVANVIRYRARSALRDVGKVLGLPETTLDRISKLVSHHDSVDSSVLEMVQLDPTLPAYRQLIQLATELGDFPRHLSIHPGGFLLGHEPVADIVPIENGAMSDRTVVQWDKDDMEELGLFKVDLLGLGALTQLDLTFRLLAEHLGVQLSMASIPADDTPTYDMISAADTIGVFQIESRAQMSMLPRLRPRKLYDLVIEVSLVRPGPITGGMVHPFLNRRAGIEKVEYPHPALAPILEKTLGVPLFQEQVMRIAVVAADYTAGEADQLRRDMAAWRRAGQIEKHRDRIRSAMMRKGITEEFAERVFNQIRGFGSYGFPESHAASFALISYASSYLKCHYPVAFACGILNAQPMGFYSPATLVEDARRHGVTILPIDVTRSAWDCTLEKISTPLHVVADPCARPKDSGFGVRMGLRFVQGLSEEQGLHLMQARAAAPFTSLADFVARTAGTASPLGDNVLSTLAEAGAFDALGVPRREAIWDVRGFAKTRTLPLPLTYRDAEHLSFAPLDFATTVNWDYRVSMHSTRGHPLEPLRAALRAQKLPSASEIRHARDGTDTRYAGLVICRQRPTTAKGVVFMTLEDETGFVNVVIWRDVFQRFALLAKTVIFLGVSGTIQSQHSVTHIIATKLWQPAIGSPETLPSRDFH